MWTWCRVLPVCILFFFAYVCAFVYCVFLFTFRIIGANYLTVGRAMLSDSLWGDLPGNFDVAILIAHVHPNGPAAR